MNEWDNRAEQKNSRARPAFQAAESITAHVTSNLSLFKSCNTLASQHWDSGNLMEAYLLYKDIFLAQSILTPTFLELSLQNGPAMIALTPNTKDPSPASMRRFKPTPPSPCRRALITWLWTTGEGSFFLLKLGRRRKRNEDSQDTARTQNWEGRAIQLPPHSAQC